MNENERIIRRLSTLVAIQSVLLALLIIGGLFAFRAYANARSLLGQFSEQDLKSLSQSVGALAKQTTERQQSLAGAMDKRAEQTLKEIKRLRQRQQTIFEGGGGPIDKMGQAVAMTQLMSDEMLLMLDHLAWTQQGAAEALRPVPAQRELGGVGGSGHERERDGVGGSGHERGDAGSPKPHPR